MCEPWLDTVDQPCGPLLIAILGWVAEQERRAFDRAYEGGKHTINADGSHTFALTVQKEDAVGEEDRKGPPISTRAAGWTPRKN